VYPAALDLCNTVRKSDTLVTVNPNTKNNPKNPAPIAAVLKLFLLKKLMSIIAPSFHT
jgi:hypothetical protein